MPARLLTIQQLHAMQAFMHEHSSSCCTVYCHDGMHAVTFRYASADVHAAHAWCQAQIDALDIPVQVVRVWLAREAEPWAVGYTLDGRKTQVEGEAKYYIAQVRMQEEE